MRSFSCVATVTVSELLKMTRSGRNKHRVYFELKRTVVIKPQFVAEVFGKEPPAYVKDREF